MGGDTADAAAAQQGLTEAQFNGKKADDGTQASLLADGVIAPHMLVGGTVDGGDQTGHVVGAVGAKDEVEEIHGFFKVGGGQLNDGLAHGYYLRKSSVQITWGNLAVEVVEELGDEAVGEPPEQGPSRSEQVDGWKGALAAVLVEGVLHLVLRCAKLVEGDPEGIFDFDIGHQFSANANAVDKSRNDYREVDAGDIAEMAETVGAVELESDFLEGLALGGVAGRVVVCFNTATRKGDVAGPGIVGMFGALDEEQARSVYFLTEDEGDGGVVFGFRGGRRLRRGLR
jgi:hypothetical protein